MKHLLNIPIFLIFIVASISCQAGPALGDSVELAASTENNVEVKIALERINNDQFILSATFIPQTSSLHLYSKDIPKTGVDGLGRPTLLELSNDSPLQALSELGQNVLPQTPVSPPFELLTYPAGPVTLSLPVLLPDGNSWSDDEVIVTYMACDEQGCRPPVQQKPIAIKIPGKDLFQ
jgi:hypothetical protein